MTDFISPAAKMVSDELTPQLRDFAREAGLSAELANSLTLVWDGERFSAQSPRSLDLAEFGDGKGPAPRPVHKAMNRLEPEAHQLLERLVRERINSFTLELI